MTSAAAVYSIYLGQSAALAAAARDGGQDNLGLGHGGGHRQIKSIQ